MDAVHRAAANEFDFRTRAARGFVCNGLLCAFLKLSNVYARRSHLTNCIE